MIDESAIKAVSANMAPGASARRMEAASAALSASKDGPPTDAAMEKARAAAEGFEAVFLAQMMGAMFEGIESNGLFGGGAGEEMWRGFFVEHVAEAHAKRGGLGIADAVMAQIIQTSENIE